jgi:Ca2+-binding EF-hand superfamily protein
MQDMGEDTMFDKQEFEEAFTTFDEDKSGTIDKDEMTQFIRRLAGV